jgi:hypothetical protein
MDLSHQVSRQFRAYNSCVQTLDGDSSQAMLGIGEDLSLAVTVYVIINHVK